MSQATANKPNPVDRVYAQSLIELAEEAGTLAEAADEAAQLSDLLASDTELQAIFASRVVSDQARAGVIDRMFKGRVSDVTWRFLQVVNRKGRSANLPGILATVGKLMDERSGKVQAHVTAAQAMDAGQLDSIAAALGASMGKQVEVTQSVDASLLGGVVVQVGDKLIDGSVATKLNSIKQQLVNAGREKARQLTAAS